MAFWLEPFDKRRDGFVMGEGAGVLLLESYQHAQRRGATILGEILGAGASSDAYKLTDMDPTGTGPYRAMKKAVQEANIDPSEIGYINAHGTSTRVNDLVESLAIGHLFSPTSQHLGPSQSSTLPLVSANKSMIGHTIAACGAIESIFTLMALQEQTVPPTANFQETDIPGNLDYVPQKARSVSLRYALKNSFAFGGSNYSLVFKGGEK